MKTETRFCADIGMFALDRPMNTCSHCTTFCRSHCYNLKLYLVYKDMSTKDIRNEAYFQYLDGQAFAKDMSKKRKDISRFRFCTRGETLSQLSDIEKIRDIALENPTIDFWLPTRAWRKKAFRRAIKKDLFPLKNVFVLASIDPSNTDAEIKGLKKSGFSTMYFGDNEKTANRIKCPKTWEKKNGHCLTCSSGCFSSGRVDIHLKAH